MLTYTCKKWPLILIKKRSFKFVFKNVSIIYKSQISQQWGLTPGEIWALWHPQRPSSADTLLTASPEGSVSTMRVLSPRKDVDKNTTFRKSLTGVNIDFVKPYTGYVLYYFNKTYLSIKNKCQRTLFWICKITYSNGFSLHFYSGISLFYTQFIFDIWRKMRNIYYKERKT